MKPFSSFTSQTSANSKIDEFRLLLTSINWTAEETPEHANGYMNEVLIYLGMVVLTAQPILRLNVS